MGRAAYSQQKDALTQESFESLLAQLHPNREQAGVEYLGLRAKLLRFFVLRADSAPSQAADETLDRVARKCVAGAVADNLEAYAYCVARMILLERNKCEQRQQAALAHHIAAQSPPYESDESARYLPKAAFFNALSETERALLKAYYADTANAAQHAALASKLGLSVNQLRLRIFRLRARLNDCASAGHTPHELAPNTPLPTYCAPAFSTEPLIKWLCLCVKPSRRNIMPAR